MAGRRRDVRGGVDRGAARLCRRPALSDADAARPGLARMTELNTSVVASPIGTGLRLDLAAAAVGRRAGAIVPLLILVVGWGAASRSGILTPFLLPPLSAV